MLINWTEAYLEHHDAVCTVLQRYLPASLRGRFDPEDFLQDAMVSLLTNKVETKSIRNLMILVSRRRIIEEIRIYCGVKGSSPHEIQLSENEYLVKNKCPLPIEIAEASELLENLKEEADITEWNLIQMKINGYSTPEAAIKLGIGLRSAQRLLKKKFQS